MSGWVPWVFAHACWQGLVRTMSGLPARGEALLLERLQILQCPSINRVPGGVALVQVMAATCVDHNLSNADMF